MRPVSGISSNRFTSDGIEVRSNSGLTGIEDTEQTLSRGDDVTEVSGTFNNQGSTFAKGVSMGPAGLPAVINLDDEESYDFDNQNNNVSQNIQNIAAQANLPEDSLASNLPKMQAKVPEVDEEEDSDFERSEGEQ